VLFWLFKAKKTKDGQVPIYVRITVSGVRDEFASGKKIIPESWDSKDEVALSSCPDYKETNNYVRRTRASIESHYERLKILNSEVTAAMIKEAMFPKLTKSKSLMQAFKLHNSLFAELVEKELASGGTLKRYERLEEKVKAFLKSRYKTDDILLDEIQHSAAEHFYHYLLLQNIGKNTAMKYVKTLKQVVTKAVKEGWLAVNAMSGFKCTYEDPDRDTLEMDEIVRMYEKEISIKRLSDVRDVYVFSCFTGYAYETLYEMEPENVFNGLDGKPWISKHRGKTGVKEAVPLLPIPLEIIERYKNHPYCIENNKLLPVNSNQRYNGYLKEVATICDINRELTTHTARHTFATTVTLENDVPIETVSKMLGHKSIRTTQIYAKITRRKIANNMAELHDRLHDASGALRKAGNA
jgi:site-specific recombinase XerD